MKNLCSTKYSFLKVIRNKKNIYYVCILCICAIFFLATLIFRNSYFKSLERDFENNVLYRNLLIGPNPDEYSQMGMDYVYDVENIKNVNHVIDVYDMKYSVYNYEIDDFKSDIHDGVIEFLYGSEVSLPKNIIGKTYEDNDTGVAICSKNFYPSIEMIDVIGSKNIFINGDKLINTTFKLEEDIYKRIDGELRNTGEKFIKEFKIIGVFDTNETGDYLNTCYITPVDSVEIFDSLSSDLNPDSLTPLVVTVDDIENLSEVAKEIRDMGYRVQNQTIVNNDLINNIKLICTLIIVTIVITIMLVTILYTRKRILNNWSEIGILKAIGFAKKDILIINIMEMLFLIIFAIVLSFIILGLMVLLIQVFFKNYLILNNIIVNYSFMTFFMTYLIIVIIPIIIEIIFISIEVNKNTMTILKRNEL